MRKCTEKDRKEILAYINKEPEMNLFIYGDIENFGVDTEEVSIYVNEKDGEWDFLLLKYFDSYILYSQKDTYDILSVVEFMKDRQIDCISGKSILIKQLESYFPHYKIEGTYMCRCNKVAIEMPQISNGILRELTVEDIDDMIELYLLIDEFQKTYRGRVEKAKEQEKINMEHGSTSYGVFVDGTLVAIAGTSASNSISAMVVGVATHPEMRGKGYAKAAVTKLCDSELKKGKQFLSLFYNNPAAGRLYSKVGFEEVGEYAMFR